MSVQYTTTVKVDLPLLKQQKQELVRMIFDDGDSVLWGIVNLLDEIQDKIETNTDDTKEV